MARRKWLYILPNLFTLASILCGFYSMTLSASGRPEALYGAALAILFGMLLDGLDGRVARLTKTQSAFGVQLDSLADVITFGAAPALLVWTWGLRSMGAVGILLAWLYVACGALRLARFNVLEMRGAKGASAYFVGLPIPLAAGVLVSLVLAHSRAAEPSEVPAVPLAVLVGLLSYLMVSNVRYRTFKQLRLSRRNAAILAFLLTTFAALAIRIRASVALVVIASLYVVLGLVEEVIFFRRRREERLLARAARAAGDGTTVVDEDDEDGAA